MKLKVKPQFFTVPITRVDEEARIVEGVAFANEVVPGEGGVRLKRSAMMEATEDYLRNGTCREMHTSSVAGRPLSVVWEGEPGSEVARISMHCVDDQAWAKVKAEVYRAFSIGVEPKVMRGKDVVVCRWWDTSLVDIGKDKDAPITLWRAGDLAEEVECEVEEDEAPGEEEELERWFNSDDALFEMAFEIERRLKKAERDALPDSDFGWKEERKYPIVTQENVDAAAKLIGKAPASMRPKIKKRIIAIAKRKKLKPPVAWADEAEDAARSEAPIEGWIERGKFLDNLKDSATRNLRWLALDALGCAIYDIQALEEDAGIDETDKAAMLSDLLDDFEEFIVPVIAAGEFPDNDVFDDEAARSLSPTLTRAFSSFEAVQTERAEQISTLERELGETKTELTRVQESEASAVARAAEAEGEVQRLKNSPRSQRPVINPETLTRSLLPGPGPDRRAELEEELAEINRMAPTFDKLEQDRRIAEIQRIKRELLAEPLGFE